MVVVLSNYYNLLSKWKLLVFPKDGTNNQLMNFLSSEDLGSLKHDDHLRAKKEGSSGFVKENQC